MKEDYCFCVKGKDFNLNFKKFKFEVACLGFDWEMDIFDANHQHYIFKKLT